MRRFFKSVSATVGIIILIAGLFVTYNYIENGGSIFLGCVVLLLASAICFLLCMDAMFSER